MSTEPKHPAHAVVIEICGRRYSMRGTFATARAIEERHGTVRAFGQSVLNADTTVEALADAMHFIIGEDKIARADIEAHFDEVGIAGVATEISMAVAQLMRGFQAISEEAEAAGASENPPETPTRKPRSDRGKPRGPRTAVCPGETSLEALQNSASPSATSGALPLTNSPASGERPNHGLLPLAMNGQPLPQTTAPITTTPSLISDPAQGIA